MRYLRCVTLLMAWTVPVVASAQGIRDDAGLFQPETLTEVRQNIAQIHKYHGKQVLIETYSSLSRLRSEGYNTAEPAHLKTIFEQWAQDRCKAEHLDGLYILICKEPKYVLVLAWPDANSSLIDADNRERVRKIIAYSLGYESSMRERLRTMHVKPRKRPKADEGLLHAMWVIDQRMEANRPVDWSGWTGGLTGIVGLLSVWMVLGLARNRLRIRAARQAINTPEQFNAPAGTPGAVLGGGMGTVVAQWLIDRWQGKPPSAEPRTVVDTSRPTFSNPTASGHGSQSL